MTDFRPYVVVITPRLTPEDRAIMEQMCAAGLAVRAAYDVSAALAEIHDSQPDVLVLMPSADECAAVGAAAAELRRAEFTGAILVVGRSSDPSAAVAALECGADDYVALSCAPTELVARVRALARRTAGRSSFGRELGGITLDLRRGVLRADGAEVELTRREADLLEYLARHAGRPVTRAELAAQIWRSTADGGTNVVDVYVSYLRRKLGAIGRRSLIRSVRGVGYELVNVRTG